MKNALFGEKKYNSQKHPNSYKWALTPFSPVFDTIINRRETHEN